MLLLREPVACGSRDTSFCAILHDASSGGETASHATDRHKDCGSGKRRGEGARACGRADRVDRPRVGLLRHVLGGRPEGLVRRQVADLKGGAAAAASAVPHCRTLLCAWLLLGGSAGGGAKAMLPHCGQKGGGRRALWKATLSGSKRAPREPQREMQAGACLVDQDGVGSVGPEGLEQVVGAPLDLRQRPGRLPALGVALRPQPRTRRSGEHESEAHAWPAQPREPAARLGGLHELAALGGSWGAEGWCAGERGGQGGAPRGRPAGPRRAWRSRTRPASSA